MRSLFTLSIFCLLFHTTLFSTPVKSLEALVKKDLELLDLPASSWRPVDNETLDVAIIGGGMLGTAVAYSLKLEGITNVKVFDRAKKGEAGPWLTCARMKTLRSGKSLQGPALGIPHLTFRAWYEAQYGKKEWKKVDKIPTKMWGKYLFWMQKILNIDISYEAKLEHIDPQEDGSILLQFDSGERIHTRKVVLATGRGGFGGAEIPDFVNGVEKKFWLHTGECIAPEKIENKRIVVVGAGASSFDAAGFSLENKAACVDMLMRRAEIPQENYFAHFSPTGFKYGYYFLPDERRLELFTKAYTQGTPPTEESIMRVVPYNNFTLRKGTCIEKIEIEHDAMKITTSTGEIEADLLFLGTGYAVDGARVKALESFYPEILLWSHKYPDLPTKLGRFPYLGPHFEFLEKYPGASPYLANIHCFNYGAFLSHGQLSGHIDSMDTGIQRLSQGIAIGLFLQDMKDGSQTIATCPNSCQTSLDGGFCKLLSQSS